MLKLFRATAILEGVSYLLLFALTMPLKYWADITEPNKVVGYVHGFLFIAYVVVCMVFVRERKWGFRKAFVLLVASLLPFGTFYAYKKYLKGLDQSS
ncbi:DUF3817 domain-containing protein [Allomuricauda sp. SCSIO 65647]|uniref:DUF3817 domain-containing protein n=1 Tax=Allomuricauda sp. SCSIO 65647 TaxID=2908843 RepID=UPI001F2A3891|nr:DUF3817 domain-containing protein [Muricauda sp. SCSIO 65647]UJH66905.1 DUF3817 domain-containing protein [Muricauda sp. SCSIO 65647]